jgi:hypothetical protein
MVPTDRLTKYLEYISHELDKEDRIIMLAGQQFLRDRWEEFVNE